jgi:hypothetical protein
MRAIIRGQMSRIGELEVTKDKNGEDLKVIYFTVADRVKYAQALKDSNGATVYKTKGFYFCKAYGRDAELIHRDFSNTDEHGKLISRKIYIEGDAQQYIAHKEIEVALKVPVEKLCNAMGIAVPEPMAGKSATVTKKEKVPYTNTVYAVTWWDYDDAKPQESVLNIEVANNDSDDVIIDAE